MSYAYILAALITLQRNPLVNDPLSGHQSQMPVGHDRNMKAPTQPTMVRPQPGHIRLPWRTCMTCIAPLLADALSMK